MCWLIALVVTTVAIQQSYNWPASPLQKANKRKTALNIKLLEPLAQGASIFEKLLAPQNPLAPNFFKQRKSE